jgi:ribosomal protein S18 acetylase RimI-like enzyme
VPRQQGAHRHNHHPHGDARLTRDDAPVVQVPEEGPAEEPNDGRDHLVELVPMNDAELGAFLARPRDGYVAELVALGMSSHQAVAKVHEEQSAAFPSGLPASGHQVFAVRRGGGRVGHLWLGPAPDGGPGSWWVWEIEIDEAAQGHGVGRRAMELAETEARRAGATALGLSVSGGNTRARRLYESLGYEPSSVRMQKPLV